MNAGKAIQHTSGWVKLAGALILLVGFLLGGILSTPPAAPVQALNPPSQVAAPLGAISNGVKGTLASFTALIPEFYATDLPLVIK
jgi:hypothetical protein